MPQHLQNLIAGYVLGDLDPEEALELEGLMATNPAIAAEITQVQKSLEMAYAPAEVAPPPQVRAAILQYTANPISSEATAGRAKISRKGLSRRLPWFDRRTLSLAAALLIIALAINNYRLWTALQTMRANAPQTEMGDRILTYTLQPTEVTSAASATVTVNPNTLAAQLKVNNLPPLLPGQIYALWTVLPKDAPYTTDPKAAILTDVFEVDAQGNATRDITVPPVYRSDDWVTKVAITLEDATAPQAHEGSPILISSQ
jgi:anti-sigma factor RsiW